MISNISFKSTFDSLLALKKGTISELNQYCTIRSTETFRRAVVYPIKITVDKYNQSFFQTWVFDGNSCVYQTVHLVRSAVDFEARYTDFDSTVNRISTEESFDSTMSTHHRSKFLVKEILFKLMGRQGDDVPSVLFGMGPITGQGSGGISPDDTPPRLPCLSEAVIYSNSVKNQNVL
ncbi:hypothetical protein CHS0354_032529 [Potamilus streckersoni]|uniref:Uncharacterized protein n=1 Tax=Potamilus streckersoni TaxID=2493646 RepID=A0AAE0VZX7_9BIVA|nr:hypothetical protein CHS0354_032529 [Potamilus streckersoni]